MSKAFRKNDKFDWIKFSNLICQDVGGILWRNNYEYQKN